MMHLQPKVGDTVSVGRHNPRQGKVIKVLEPRDIAGGLASPGGLVVDNPVSTFYVAPWEKVTIVLQQQNLPSEP